MLEISDDEKKGITILRLNGRLDATSVPALDLKLSEKVQEGKNKVVLDLRKLDYLSSAGMRLLLGYTKKLKNNGGSLNMFGPVKEILEIIKMGGFEQILQIYNDEKEALELA